MIAGSGFRTGQPDKLFRKGGELPVQVWRDRDGGNRGVVRSFVRQLCTKLGDDAANPLLIFNARGVGTRIPCPGEPPPP